MATMEVKSLEAPDQAMEFPLGKAEVVSVGGLSVTRVVTEPGWRWSESLKPAVGTDSCQKPHLIYVISGRLGTRMDDGTEAAYGPGEVANVPPGHDGWTDGDEPAVWLDFGAAVAGH